MIYQKQCFLLIILICGFCSSLFSQPSFHKENGVVRISSVDSFLERNSFEYAIVAYSTSSRGFGESKYSCLVKQEGLWYLLQITASLRSAPVAELHPHPTIKHRKLTISQADSLLSIIEPEKGMKHTQEEFYALPVACDSEFREKKGMAGGVSDAATYRLTEKSDKGIISLSFYAADFYLRNCLPLNAEFKILTGMVNSVDRLTSAANSL